MSDKSVGVEQRKEEIMREIGERVDALLRERHNVGMRSRQVATVLDVLSEEIADVRVALEDLRAEIAAR